MSDLMAFAGIAALIIIQICLFSYGYGKLSQKVEHNFRRLDRLEDRIGQLEKTVSKMDISVARFNNKG